MGCFDPPPPPTAERTPRRFFCWVDGVVFRLTDDRINLHPADHHVLVSPGAAVEQMVPGEELLPGADGGCNSGAD